jgi:hypothetical protein
MNALLFTVILLFLILCIGFKEGYYSDTYTNAAATSMSTLVAKLNTVQNTLEKLVKDDAQTLNLDAQSMLNPLLHPPDETKYSLGIVEQAYQISNRISVYQDRLLVLKNTIHEVNDIPIHFKEGDMTLSQAIQTLKEEANSILTQLNQISDS